LKGYFMRSKGHLIAALLATSLSVVIHAQVPGAPTFQAGKPSSVSMDVAEARADRLVKQLSREEKLRLVHGYFPPFVIGKPSMPTDLIPSAGYVPGVPRLGIPVLRESDASLGVANQVEQRKGDVATALPSSLATAASFDPSIAHAGGAMIGAEARAKTFNVLLAGGVNLTRDPWNGRNFEYLGEDPLLAGRMAGASIRGVQSNGIVSTVKHFALNSQETGRMVLNARLGEAALRESDLLAFQIAIEIGQPGSVMCAYNQINGDYACENHHLLTDVLRTDWGYKGFVMSDWGAVHSTVKAANAGLDQQSGQELDKAPYFGAPLAKAVADGTVPAAQLDTMVRRILTGIIASGLMDRPLSQTSQPIDYAAHADVAQRTAEAGIVLLKNDKDLLPLARTAKRILLVGGHADVGVLSGGGSSQVRSVGGAPVEIPLKSGAAASFARLTYHASSPLNAIRKIAPGAVVTYVDGSDRSAAAAAAKQADTVIVFATQWQTEAQDTETLALPDGQDALIEAVAAANPRTAVVLETGGPVLMPWLSRVPAVIEAWYPGQRGGEAIANILFGAVNPSGRLPITFPAAAAQAPRPTPVGLDKLKDPAAATAAANSGGGSGVAVDHFPVEYPEGSNVGYRWYEAKGLTPLFAFGHGLSYTTFAYSKPVVVGGKEMTIRFTVKNVGKVAGADVPQVYAKPAGGRWPARLVGFSRVTLDPGASVEVTINADARVLADWNVQAHGFRIAPGHYTVGVGRSQGTTDLSVDIGIEAKVIGR
jgi:beta-glucosidase